MIVTLLVNTYMLLNCDIVGDAYMLSDGDFVGDYIYAN